MNPDLNNLSLAELQARVNAACAESGYLTNQVSSGLMRWAFGLGREMAAGGITPERARELLASKQQAFNASQQQNPTDIVLRAFKERPMSRFELMRATNLNPKTIGRAVDSLIRRGKIYTLTRGVYQPVLALLCVLLVVGCQTTSSVTPSETPVAVSRKPISGGIPPLPAAPLQKRVAAAVIGPPAPTKPLLLTWDMPPGATVTRLESSTDLQHWQLLAVLTNVNRYEVSTDQPQMFVRQGFPDEKPWHWWDHWNAKFRTERWE